MDKQELWLKCVAFHGHKCGGLTIGFKAAARARDPGGVLPLLLGLPGGGDVHGYAGAAAGT